MWGCLVGFQKKSLSSGGGSGEDTAAMGSGWARRRGWSGRDVAAAIEAVDIVV